MIPDFSFRLFHHSLSYIDNISTMTICLLIYSLWHKCDQHLEVMLTHSFHLLSHFNVTFLYVFQTYVKCRGSDTVAYHASANPVFILLQRPTWGEFSNVNTAKKCTAITDHIYHCYSPMLKFTLICFVCKFDFIIQ